MIRSCSAGSGRPISWEGECALRVRSVACVFLAATALVVVSGCAPFSTFQSPEVLGRGRAAVGVGMVTVKWDESDEEDEDDMGSLPAIWFRTAPADNTDVGLSLNLFGSAMDVKRVLYRGPILVTGDLGFCFASDDLDGEGVVMLRPSIIVGTDHVYGSAWGAYAFPTDDTVVAQGFMVGASLGGDLRLMGEYDFFQMGDKDSPSSAYAVGLQWAWGGDTASRAGRRLPN